MNQSYYVFGLKILSELPLPAPMISDPAEAANPDIVIAYGPTPEKLDHPQTTGVRYQASPDELLLCVDGVARYWIRQGRRILVTAHPQSCLERILIFLMGSAMGALLHQRGILVLHAGAVSADKGAIALAGPSGIGKSTLSAALHDRGYPFVADDVCAIDPAGKIPSLIPGFSRLKLWADSLDKLGKSKNDLQSVRWIKNLEKYFIPMQENAASPVALLALFVLDAANTDRIEMNELTGADKINQLISNTYRMGFIKGLGKIEIHFRQCAALAEKIPVFRVTRPRGGFHLEELADKILARVNP